MLNAEAELVREVHGTLTVQKLYRGRVGREEVKELKLIIKALEELKEAVVEERKLVAARGEESD